MEQNNGYKYFYFEVRNEKGRLQATFARRYEAEEYANKHRGCTVIQIEEN